MDDEEQWAILSIPNGKASAGTKYKLLIVSMAPGSNRSRDGPTFDGTYQNNDRRPSRDVVLVLVLVLVLVSPSLPGVRWSRGLESTIEANLRKLLLHRSDIAVNIHNEEDNSNQAI